jgi:serine/threonine protein phosphatase 1
VWNSSPSLQSQRAPAKLPNGLRTYAIGGIHGRADLLVVLFRQIDVDCKLSSPRRPIVVFVGDYIDRGPASREVLDLLIGYERTKETIFLRGNHETFVHRFLSEPAILDEWRLCGGLETLLIRTPLKEHGWPMNWPSLYPNGTLNFSNPSIFCSNCGDFVHADVRPGVPVRKQRKKIYFGFVRSFSFATGRLTCIVIEGASIVELNRCARLDTKCRQYSRCSECTDED